MKIISITDEMVLFDNGNAITYEHNQECCERNYADFAQIDDIAKTIDFEKALDFEAVNDSGFIFGNLPNKMFFVPCYSIQNGYYSSEIDIYYNHDSVLSVNCDEIDREESK